MFLDKLAPAWEDFHQRLRARPRLIVVDDDLEVVSWLAEHLSQHDFNVDTAPTAEDAWERLGRTRYDLLITDKNLPGESGLALIARVREARLGLPSMLVTGYPSLESVLEMVSCGAVDYVIKPIELTHLLARVRTLLDRRMNGLLFDRIVKDLSGAINAGGVDGTTLSGLKAELTTYRVILGSGPKVLLLDDDRSSAPEVREALEAAELFSVMDDETGTLRWVAQPGGPLVVVFDLARPGSLDLIRALRSADAQLEIMVTMHDDALDRALGAITAGASDFVLLGADGAGLLGARVRRLVARGHRTRLYLHLVATLYRLTRRFDEPLAERIVSMATPEQQTYIREAPVVAARATGDFDLEAWLRLPPT